MSHTRKDGRHGGGHRDPQCHEVWSKRCKKVDMWSKNSHKRKGVGYKTISHRIERRVAKRLALSEITHGA